MKKIFSAIFFLFVFFLPFPGFCQNSSQVVVEGDPPITMEAVKSHIRLMEFVLSTRLTTNQKNLFLGYVKEECKGMDKQSRSEFLQGMELFQSLSTMPSDQVTSVREVLRADFEQSADEVEEDPAAKLFFKVVGNLQKKISETQAGSISTQAFEALVEYMEFSCSLSGKPKTFSEEEREKIRKVLVSSFEKLTETAQAEMSTFERKWHVIKAAWASDSSPKKDAWTKLLVKPFSETSRTFTIDEKLINQVVQPSLWEEIASSARVFGETESDWVASKTVDVW